MEELAEIYSKAFVEMPKGNYLVDDFLNESFDKFNDNFGKDHFDIYQKFIKRIKFIDDTCNIYPFLIFENLLNSLKVSLKYSDKNKFSIKFVEVKQSESYSLYILMFHIPDLSFSEENSLIDELIPLYSENTINRLIIRKSIRSNKVKKDFNSTAIISFSKDVNNLLAY